jgi:hypothetical protein
MSTPSDAAPCAHTSALMCDAADLHESNRASIFFFCIECGQFLNDELISIEGDPLQEPITSPQFEAGTSPAQMATHKETQGQPQELQNNSLLVAGMQNGNAHSPASDSRDELLSIGSSTLNKNGKGSGKARKLPEEQEIEKYGRVLPGPWHGVPCPNSYKKCSGSMEAFYTLEFEEGNSYMYKCTSCSVITSICFRESNIHYAD